MGRDRGREQRADRQECGMDEDDVVRAVYERSYRALVTHFIALSGNRSEAEDLVQEAFLLADAHPHDFADAADKDAWLRAVGLQVMRRRRRWSRLAGVVVPRFRTEANINLGRQAPEDHVAVIDALNRLSLPVRHTAALHFLGHASVAQIASELSVPEGLVNGRLARARAELAALSAITETSPTAALSGFAGATEQSLDQAPYPVMMVRRRTRHRRRAVAGIATALAAGLGVVLVLVLTVAGLDRFQQTQAAAARRVPLLLPDWTAAQVVTDPNAFVVTQFESRTHPEIGLTVWKRCTTPRADHDCFGREAISVSDGAGHRLDTLGAVTGSSQQPQLGDDGLFREVGDGQWYWAHRNPGPYLVSADLAEPVRLTLSDRPVARSFGVPSIECPDRVGLCTLDVNARAIERLARPDVPDARWATPTASGCGLWALAGVGGNVRLVIQQRDGSFSSADLPDDSDAIAMAEGAPGCAIAYYQAVDLERCELVVSLDEGRTWQVRQTATPHVAGYLEQNPRPRVLVPTQWQKLPPMPRPVALPGPLHPL